MIKKIYQLADVHIPNYRKMDMYVDQLEKVVNAIKENAKKSKLRPEEMRIVICGDLVDSKNNVSNELYDFVASLIRDHLSTICKVLIIAGNHDFNKENTCRKDTLTGIFNTANFDNAIFVDQALDYESGIIPDDNVCWALYSAYDNFEPPQIQQARIVYPDNKVIGLFHDMIVGSKMCNGFIADSGCDVGLFDGCDVVMAGHIHKRQIIEGNDCKIVYVGSTIQKDFGENITQHGFAIWDVDTLTCEFVDIPSEYGYYDITINSIDDLKEDKEILNNY